MTRKEHALTKLAEECAETAQRVTKALRFGLDEVQPSETDNPQRLTNLERIQDEFKDIVAAMYIAGLAVSVTEADLQPRFERYDKYLKIAEDCGAVTKR